MRQRTLAEAKWYALTLNILLPDACHDLRDVDVAAFGAGTHHVAKSVRQTKAVKSDVARLVASIIELLVDLGLETLLHRLAWLRLQLPQL